MKYLYQIWNLIIYQQGTDSKKNMSHGVDPTMFNHYHVYIAFDPSKHRQHTYINQLH